MPDKTYTQAEHDAILAAAVERETASLTETIASAQAAQDETASRLDVVEAEKAAAETRATKAEGDLETFKSEIAAEKAAKERRDSRASEMAAVATTLGADWHTDERKDRWARMSDEDFAAQKGEIAEIASKVTNGEGKAPEAKPLPTETAANTARSENTEGAVRPAATVLGLRRGRKVS